MNPMTSHGMQQMSASKQGLRALERWNAMSTEWGEFKLLPIVREGYDRKKPVTWAPVTGCTWLSSPCWLYSRSNSLSAFNTREWEPVTMTLQALSLVEKAEPVQVRFTLRLRDHRSMWMQDACKVYMGSYMGIEWIMFHGHLDYFQKPSLGGRSNPNWEIMVLWMLTTVDLFYFIMCDDPRCREVNFYNKEYITLSKLLQKIKKWNKIVSYLQ